MNSIKIIVVAGARPNFMKIAPIMESFDASDRIEPVLVHTGQHYDEKMSDLFFRQLGIPSPDVNLGVGSGSHAVQTAEIMKSFEPVLISQQPAAVLVVGDVNSTIACGYVAAKMGIKLIHVEAGLRSFDRAMPEEINRVLTDAISDILFCTEKSGVENLKKEGVTASRIFMVGNVMIDTLLKNLEKAKQSPIMQQLNLKPGSYATMTMHRPSNVDNPDVLVGLLDAIEVIQRDIPIIFPIHPRTRNNIVKFKFADRMKNMPNLRFIEPLGYLDFLLLNANAACVLTDSGGLQEETTVLGTPCITMRENTERPITCEVGTNQIVGTDTDAIIAAWTRVQNGEYDKRGIPEMWDGKAADRITQILLDILG
ncbi:MAG TPA: UDP-N-acetylglucosamine 2-epimerase (non-hydrolyzing) [Phycisphaerae bacterium]|nr:UDP-N-acetylglucosamine 2-epimerase (non-hydrolyzing) [Phycisphaerae bacterium]HPS52569.1 UDP-N-acetylglucosamine 2-epimerase (non-hydrolyzing) [Phycisphaerae bacterium]